MEIEHARRESLCCSSQAQKMENNFDPTNERECSVCLFDLHLSAVRCPCSPDKYTCLNHASQMCLCGLATKSFLFRYNTSELHILVQALEGKLSAIYRWGSLDLGLALTWPISKNNSQDSKLSYAQEESKSIENHEFKNPLVGPDDIVLLSDDEGDEAKETWPSSSISPRNDNKDSTFIAPTIDTLETRKNNVNSVPDGKRKKCLFEPVLLKESHHQPREIPNSYYHSLITCTGLHSNAQDSSVTRETINETEDL